jgi:hypothetical protein
MPTRTLALDPKNWDLRLDTSGHLALHAGALAISQNVANQARLFSNDAYFIQDQGIPHFLIDLGRSLNTPLLRSYLRRAALKVPEVKEVLEVEISGFDPETRRLSGKITFSLKEGENHGPLRIDF